MKKRQLKKSLAILMTLAMVISFLPSVILVAEAAPVNLAFPQIGDSSADESSSSIGDMTLTVNAKSGGLGPYAIYQSGELYIADADEEFGSDYATFEKTAGSLFAANSISIRPKKSVNQIAIYGLNASDQEIATFTTTKIEAGEKKAINLASNSNFTSIRKLKIVVPETNFYVCSLDVAGPNTAPTFVGSTTTLSVNQNAAATDITGLLHVSDTDASQTLTWTQTIAPTHGTLAFTDATASSSPTEITPGGTITYKPDKDYAGTDTFTIQVSDGTATAERKIDVTVEDITKPTIISPVSPPTGKTYGIGQNLDYTVTFSEPVKVVTTSGTPYLTLTVGSSEVHAAYQSGSGTKVLTFRYTVTSGDTDTDGVALSNDLDLKGGTIKDLAENDATLTFTGGTAASVLVDGVAPSAPSAPVLAPASDSGKSSADKITNVKTPTFTGTGEEGSTVKIYDSDGITALGTVTATGGNWSMTAATLAEGTHSITAKATDVAGNTSDPSSALSVTIDATGATVTSVTVPTGTSYKAGQNLDFTVSFNEPVTVIGTPRIALKIGSTTQYASYLSGSDGAALNFRYTVQSGDDDNNGIELLSLEANGGTLCDTAGNNATLTLKSVGSTTGILLDNMAPSAPTLAMSSDVGISNADGITNTTSQTITVTGEVGASVNLDFGDGSTHATGTIGAGGTFTSAVHTYASGKYTLSATLTDVAGNQSTAGTKNIVIDTIAPLITTSSNQTISKMVATHGATVCTLEATDATVPDLHVWSLSGGSDKGKFSISGAELKINQTGGLSAGNYSVEITAMDTAGNTNVKTLTMTVVSGPTVSAASQSYTDTVGNDTFSNAMGSISATASSDTITGYGINGGATDNALAGYTRSKIGAFGTLYVNDKTGAYVYVPTSDKLLNAQTVTVMDSFTIEASDSAGTAENTLTVTINGVNDAPTLVVPPAASFTDTVALDTFSNTTGTLSGNDCDNGASLRYSIPGGTTGGSTDIGGMVYDISQAGTYGTLHLKSSDGHYAYVPNANVINAISTNQSDRFTISVSDGMLSATQTYTVNITAANDAPTVGVNTGITVNEGSVDTVIKKSNLEAIDVDTVPASIAYTLTAVPANGPLKKGGIALAVNGTFTQEDINNGTITYTHSGSETVSDSFKFTVSDNAGGSITETRFAITVAPVNDAPTINSGESVSFAENAVGIVYTATGSDEEGSPITWCLEGADKALFNIEASTGALTFKIAPNYEDKKDADADNVYDIKVIATDNCNLTASKDVAIKVTNINEAPTVTSVGTVNFAENGSGSVYTATRTDPDVGDTVIWSLDGADKALFNINANTGVLSFKASPNFEDKKDAGADNVYNIKVIATDGGNLPASKDVAITVTNVNEAPTITSGTLASVTDGASGTVYTAAANDPEGDAIRWSLAGVDAGKLTLSSAGVLTFNTVPNYTTPGDDDKNNIYNLIIRASDSGGNLAEITLAVTVSQRPSGGGGGGSGSSIGTTGTTVVEVNGQKQDAGTVKTQTSAGQTVTTITVDDGKLNKVLEGKGEKPTVTLPTNTTSGVVVGELSGQTVKNMEKKDAVLEIKTGTVSYTLPASQINIDAVSSQLGSQVELKDIKVNVKIAEPSADTVKIVEDTAKKGSYQIVVKPVEFEISCISGKNTVEVSKFNGYVERTVAIPNGVDPSKITTGIVLNSDGSFRHVPTSITKVNGKYFAKINSLTNSTYSVIWNPVTFADVANHWAKDAVNDMGSRMVVTGVSKNSYEPDRSITRGEFAAIVVRALGLAQGTKESSFGDVSQSEWFNGYVDTATAYALIAGYDSKTFAPKDTITREQAMAILARAMKTTGLKVVLTDAEVSTMLAKYEDGNAVSDYAKASVATCLKSGVVTGSSATTLSPKAYVTRAEVAVMVQQLLQKSKLI